VVAGLRGASNFASVFGETGRAERYKTAADDIVTAMFTHLFDAKDERFLRSLLANETDGMHPDATIDASLFGIFYFGCFNVNSEPVAKTMRAVEDRLGVDGGIARYESDGYMRSSDAGPGNVWFICTLWLAEFYIAKARAAEDLEPAMKLIRWCVDRALPSGVLSEQFDVSNGKQVSVSPLTWSHSTFVSTTMNYQRKAAEIALDANL